MMVAIREAGLTDLDFKKFPDFLKKDPSKETARNIKEVFTAYLNVAVPAKIGDDLNRFNQIAEALVRSNSKQGSPLKGTMFENFAALQI